MSVTIRTSTEYLLLDCWVLANIIQLATMNFCRRFLNRQNDPCGRQFDQMTQAARSVTANIAEGTSRHDTSIEMEMRLLDVARASSNELMGDFMFLLADKGLVAWSESHPLWQEAYKMKLTVPEYGNDLLRNATEHILREKKRFDHLVENNGFETAANTILALCTRVRVILTKRLESILADFEQNGGFTENMTDTRLKARQKMSEEDGAPRCPECGAVMIRRMAKKGSRAGHEFWSCSNHTITGCEGLIDIKGFNKKQPRPYETDFQAKPLVAAEPEPEYGIKMSLRQTCGQDMEKPKKPKNCILRNNKRYIIDEDIWESIEWRKILDDIHKKAYWNYSGETRLPLSNYVPLGIFKRERIIEQLTEIACEANNITFSKTDETIILPQRFDYDQEGRVVQLPTGSFEEILTRFRLFVKTNQRFPFMDGSPGEASLRKWHREVNHGLIPITEGQKLMFDLLATEFPDVPKHREK